MLSILCPHCGTKLTLETQWQGRTVNCLQCAKQLVVPHADSSATTAAVTPSLAAPAISVATQPTSARRRRKRSIGNRIINSALHLSITAATIYAGYYLITQRRPAAPQPTAAIVEPTTLPKPSKPRLASLPRNRKIASPPTEPQPMIAEPEPVQAKVTPTSPFLSAPRKVSLPSSGDLAIVDLKIGVGESSIGKIDFRLASNSAGLAHEDRRIFWQDAEGTSSIAVAGLALIDGTLKFRWLDSVPPDAEAAVRNSIVQVSQGEFEHILCLREAEVVEPLQVDLNKPRQRIVSKCEHQPAVSDICFELVGIEQLPACITEGVEADRLQIRDQTLLQYLDAPSSTTNLSMKKRGKLAIVELASSYALPSGGEQPMSIARGNNKLKELNALHQEALEAEAALSDSQVWLKKLQKESKAVPRSRATATAKSIRLRELQSEIIQTQQRISYAERLLSQKKAIEADLQALQQVAKLAQQLHQTKLAYRFYTVVEGHEVDFLVTR